MQHLVSFCPLSIALLVSTSFGCSVAPEPVPPFDDTPAALPDNLPTADELAVSPRDNARAEVAALVVDRDRWIASQATYDRVVADFDAIDAALPDLAYGNSSDWLQQPTGVNLTFVYGPDDPDIVAANDAAADEAADIVDALGGRTTYRDESSFQAAWPARLQPAFVGETFAAIDNVASANAGEQESQGGPVIEVEQYDGDGTRVWLMLGFGGDCPEGCTELQASRVRVEPGDDVELLDTYDSNGSAPCPQWLAVRPGICERYAPQG